MRFLKDIETELTRGLPTFAANCKLGFINEIRKQIYKTGRTDNQHAHSVKDQVFQDLFKMLELYDKELENVLIRAHMQDQYYKESLAKLDKFNMLTNKPPRSR